MAKRNFFPALALCLFLPFWPALAQAQNIDMIFWEKQSWMTGGPSQRLTLWADGRSEITVMHYGNPGKPKPGWEASACKPYTCYRKENPLPPQVAKDKFNAALAAGIELLRTFPPNYADGGGTLAGVESNGKTKETIIPEFLDPKAKDNQGSENHKRFLAVEKIIGDFDMDATQEKQQ